MAINCSKVTDLSPKSDLAFQGMRALLSLPSAADHRHSTSLQGSIQPLGLTCLLLQAVSSQASRAHKWSESEALVTGSVLESIGQTLLGSAFQVRMLFPWANPALFCQEEFPA